MVSEYMTMREGESYSQRAFQSDLVPVNALDALLRDRSLAILQLRSDINWFPLHRCLLFINTYAYNSIWLLIP
jgi:hypothetical protein